MYLDIKGRAEQVQLQKANKTTLSPACSVHQLFSTGPPHLPPSVSSTLSPAPAISLALTDTARRAGLPVVSIFHLDAGDSALPLQFITWITRKGHRVARLPTFPVATAIHRNTGISAGCSQWTWRANTHKHTHKHTCSECHLHKAAYAADSCQPGSRRKQLYDFYTSTNY